MIHGTKDTDVPYELSADMAKELAKHKVVHELVTVPEAGHGLPWDAPDAFTAVVQRFLNGN